MKLSAIVITKNEEKRIERCLKSLLFCDEIIIVDALSTDKTVEKAKAMGANVFTREWPGYGAQKNFGREQASGDWLLFIDADEEITPSLADEIRRTINNARKDFYWLKIITIFLHSPLSHLYGHNPRLFKKDSGRWNDAHVHEQVLHIDEEIHITLGDTHSDTLQEPLLHHSHESINSYLIKMHRYTDLDAEQMLATNKHRNGKPVSPSFFLPYYLAARQTIKLLFYRKGILDGIAGIIWCFLSGYYEYEMSKKYISLRHNQL